MNTSSQFSSLRAGIIVILMLVMFGCSQQGDEALPGDPGSTGSVTVPDDAPVIEPETEVEEKPVFQVIDSSLWNETSIGKVLHTFAYGGLADSAQISLWASMEPGAAIAEMLNFAFVNDRLSPVVDQSAEYATSIQELQNYWGSLDSSDYALSIPDYNNPMQWQRRSSYATLTSSSLLSKPNMQRAWVQAVNTRGINPFLHKIAFYLSNYQMAVTILRGKIGLTRDYYDQLLLDLAEGKKFSELIANAAKAAAVAKRYNHRSNMYDNENSRFSGNDDFAREYFQLFFRHQGETELQDYHENVTIENMALLLTGMDIDKKTFNHGSIAPDHWWMSPLQFTDHFDENFRAVNNESNHHAGCVEILHQQICGLNAGEKIDTLSAIVAQQQEVMDNLPVYIISSLADNQLSDQDKREIRGSWLLANDNLLDFIRSYAISTQFHSSTRVKYLSSFDRNLSLYNAVVVDNEEALTGRSASDSALQIMTDEGADVFQPSHDVFGGQTGIEASKSSYLFKRAFETAAINFGSGLTRYERTFFTDESATELATWEKDWSRIVPLNEAGLYQVADIADWLWRRMIVDAGNNMDSIARAQIYSLLAYGHDFGYQVTVELPLKSSDPEATYSSTMLETDSDFIAMLNAMSNSQVLIDSSDENARKEANRRINLAAGFISMMPYTFVETGQ